MKPWQGEFPADNAELEDWEAETLLNAVFGPKNPCGRRGTCSCARCVGRPFAVNPTTQDEE